MVVKRNGLTGGRGESVCRVIIKVATREMAAEDNWLNEERIPAIPFKKDFNYRLKELYSLYEEMCGTGNLLSRFYYGTVLFYEAELNKHGIVKEKRYLVIGQKFSNGIKYHSVTDS